jgi:hypothetical protein
MHFRRFNLAQRTVLVVGVGIGLYLLGVWLIGVWQGDGVGPSGWVGYAPLTSSGPTPLVVLHPWVRLLIWLALTAVWVLTSLAIMSSRRATPPSVEPGELAADS